MATSEDRSDRVRVRHKRREVRLKDDPRVEHVQVGEDRPGGIRSKRLATVDDRLAQFWVDPLYGAPTFQCLPGELQSGCVVEVDEAGQRTSWSSSAWSNKKATWQSAVGSVTTGSRPWRSRDSATSAASDEGAVGLAVSLRRAIPSGEHDRRRGPRRTRNWMDPLGFGCVARFRCYGPPPGGAAYISSKP